MSRHKRKAAMAIKRVKAWLGLIKFNVSPPLPPKPKVKVYCRDCKYIFSRGDGTICPPFCRKVTKEENKEVVYSVSVYGPETRITYISCERLNPCIDNANNDCPDFETWADYHNDRSQTS